MRLTLRTLLAALDQVVPPEDQAILVAKLRQSPAARQLCSRIERLFRDTAVASPAAIEGHWHAGAVTATSIAEYLDNVLAADDVEAFERTCLASDVHLHEVASCHRLIADIARESRSGRAPLDDASLKNLSTLITHRVPTAKTQLCVPMVSADPNATSMVNPETALPIEESSWWIKIEGKKSGPVSLEKLQSLAHSGDLPRSALLWRQGLERWITAAEHDNQLSLNFQHQPQKHSFRFFRLPTAAVGISFLLAVGAAVFWTQSRHQPTIGILTFQDGNVVKGHSLLLRFHSLSRKRGASTLPPVIESPLDPQTGTFACPLPLGTQDTRSSTYRVTLHSHNGEIIPQAVGPSDLSDPRKTWLQIDATSGPALTLTPPPRPVGTPPDA